MRRRFWKMHFHLPLSALTLYQKRQKKNLRWARFCFQKFIFSHEARRFVGNMVLITLTHPACRTPHTPSHSTVCSAPKPDMDYRRLHTSERSDGKEKEIHTLVRLLEKNARIYCTDRCEYTCSIKCLCEASWRSRSWLSRCSLKVSRNSFCLLISVARMREPSCCSMSCLQSRGGGTTEPKQQKNSCLHLFLILLANYLSVSYHRLCSVHCAPFYSYVLHGEI